MGNNASSPAFWYNLGCRGGGTVDGRLYTAVECHQRALDMDPQHSGAWLGMGRSGGGHVAGRLYSRVECYGQALVADPKNAQAWNQLGSAGGGQVGDTLHGQLECYVRAVEIDPKHSKAWYNMGVVGGGRIGGAQYTEAECYRKALEADPKHASAWYNLGVDGGGKVGGRDFSEAECYGQALEADAGNAKAWRNLGLAGGGRVGGRRYTAVQCQEEALEAGQRNVDAQGGPRTLLASHYRAVTRPRAPRATLSRPSWPSAPSPKLPHGYSTADGLFFGLAHAARTGEARVGARLVRVRDATVTEAEVAAVQRRAAEEVVAGRFQDVQQVASWVWTWPGLLGSREVSPHINDMVRSDDADTLQVVVPLVRALNTLSVAAGDACPARKPLADRTFRGAGLPVDRMSFFAEAGRQYRVSMLVSTSESESVAKRFAERRARADKVATVFTVHFDPARQCKHVSYVGGASMHDGEGEFLFPPYSVFTVKTPPRQRPDGFWHVEVLAACDNEEFPRNLPTCSWH